MQLPLDIGNAVFQSFRTEDVVLNFIKKKKSTLVAQFFSQARSEFHNGI